MIVNVTWGLPGKTLVPKRWLGEKTNSKRDSPHPIWDPILTFAGVISSGVLGEVFAATAPLKTIIGKRMTPPDTKFGLHHGE